MESQFDITFRDIKSKIVPYDFVVTDYKYSPEHMGSFYINLSNGQYWIRMTNDKGQFFLEAQKQDIQDWKPIISFLDLNFPGSSVAFDMKLHQYNLSDFSLETTLKFIPKILSLLNVNKEEI